MALIVEDGSIVTGADSYFSLATAEAYAAAHGLIFPIGAGGDATQVLAEQAARRGSSYIDWKFRTCFPGTRKAGRAQVFEWPRNSAYDINGDIIPSTEVPVEVVYAAIEASVRELATPGGLSPDITTGTIKKRVKVGSVEVEYAGNGDAASQRPIISRFTDILYPILIPGYATASFAIAERI